MARVGRKSTVKMQPDGTLAKPANDGLAKLHGLPSFYALIRQGEKFKAVRIVTRKKIKSGVNKGKTIETIESDEDYYKRLWWRIRAGDFVAGENPISMLVHHKTITEDEAREADRLRYLWQKLYGSPEARISAYGEFSGRPDPNTFPEREAAEYDHKTTSLQAWTSKWCLGQVLNMAVFRRPADIAAVKRGLRALVRQDFVPVNWEDHNILKKAVDI